MARLDEEKKGGGIPQTEKILLDYDSIFNKDSVLVYPISLVSTKNLDGFNL